ncbi:MAG: pyruvate ferredoxin oxidoreductase [Patescibacteria group bacterium]
MSKITLALTGAHAVAEAMRQINPGVVAIFPITPQTPIVEKYSEYYSNGVVDTELIKAESEHSALSITAGAQAAGVRAMTATSSQGLAYMWEIVGAVAGLRLPIVMPVTNRALGAPINIHCDHADSMYCRDLGWIHIFSETAQEAYENTLLAIRLAEKVSLPVMVLQDGFITSHSVERVDILDDDSVKKFVGEYKPKSPLLDTNNSKTVGPIQLQDYYFETQYQGVEAMENVAEEYLKIGKELEKLTGTKYELFEEYRLDDAEVAIIVSSSTAGTTKEVVDRMRDAGKKVGLLNIKLFRPFPYKEIAKALNHLHLNNIAVLDRSLSRGAMPPLYTDIKLSVSSLNKIPKIQSYVFGLGGRDIIQKDIEEVFENLLKGKVKENETEYIGLRK